jgi:hypothetical protein
MLPPPTPPPAAVLVPNILLDPELPEPPPSPTVTFITPDNISVPDKYPPAPPPPPAPPLIVKLLPPPPPPTTKTSAVSVVPVTVKVPLLVNLRTVYNPSIVAMSLAGIVNRLD